MIKISFWGDCKINNVAEVSIESYVGSVLESCDVNVINFEAPVKNCGVRHLKSGPVNHQDERVPEWLVKSHFNMISLANNHIMDYGVEGYKATIDSFKEVTVVGAGNWDEAYQMKVLSIKNKKIGFISLTHCEFGTLTDITDKENYIGAAWICHPQIPFNIISHKKKVDFLIILTHAGVENIDTPLPEWREVYRSFIDLGADIVVGTHPHVPQGWEIYNGKSIFYSLGNFCFQKKSNLKGEFWNDSLGVILNIKEDLSYSFEVKNVCFNNNSIHFSNDERIIMHTEYISSLMENEELYIARLNEHVLNLFGSYRNLFHSSGYFQVEYNLDFIKNVIKAFVKKKRFPPTHLINNIRCESHRWTILRAIKIENSIM